MHAMLYMAWMQNALQVLADPKAKEELKERVLKRYVAFKESACRESYACHPPTDDEVADFGPYRLLLIVCVTQIVSCKGTQIVFP